ncbi:hypothetical protein GOBAR_DD36033 [Gossypium barbadense]|nr:hypothetical protein GOBAR_DD36033 [Gossypium barbadense]
MRRQGQYADSGGNAYVSAQMQHMPAQRMEIKSGQFQGQLEAFTPERDQPYRTPKSDGQWRWERDGSKVSNQMTPKMFNEGKIVSRTLFLSLHKDLSHPATIIDIYIEVPLNAEPDVKFVLLEPVAGQVMLPFRVSGQGTDGSRTYFQGQRPDPNLSLEKQNADLRSRPHDENMEVGYEHNLLPPTLEGLEKKFHDDIMKLAKEQNDAEDAENSRHRESLAFVSNLCWQGNSSKVNDLLATPS